MRKQVIAHFRSTHSGSAAIILKDDAGVGWIFQPTPFAPASSRNFLPRRVRSRKQLCCYGAPWHRDRSASESARSSGCLVRHSDGCSLRTGLISSRREAASNIFDSANHEATIWTPIGRPLLLVPNRIVMAGLPVRLKIEVAFMT